MAYQEGQLIADRYRILKLIGSGGMASIYLAVDTFLNTRQVAIKIDPIHSNDQLLQPNTHEIIRTIAQFDYPNILLIFNFGIDKEKNVSYVIYEYFPEGTLRQRHPIGTRVPLRTVISYVKQVASTLQYIHDRGIVHRDVKPENIFIKADGSVVLGDFGIAATISNETSNEQTAMAGTPRYMAPEQLQGQILPANDQYALGSVTYEWLSGQTPFSGQTQQQLFEQILHTQPHHLSTVAPEVPYEIAVIVMRALSKEPQNRFPNIKAFANALEQAYLSHTQYTFSAEPSTEHSSPSRTSNLIGDEPHLQRTLPSIQAGPVGIPSPGRPFSRPTEPPDRTSIRGTPPPPQITGSLLSSAPSPRFELPSIFSRTSEALTNLFSRKKKQAGRDTELSLVALARTTLEQDDRAIVGNTYIIQAGISQQRQEQFQNVSFTISVQDPLQHIIFHILFHTSENITLLGASYQPPYQSLRYNPTNTDLQFISRQFRVKAPGPSYLLVNFYRERQWLKTIRFTFDGIEQSVPSTSRGER